MGRRLLVGKELTKPRVYLGVKDKVNQECHNYRWRHENSFFHEYMRISTLKETVVLDIQEYRYQECCNYQWMRTIFFNKRIYQNKYFEGENRRQGNYDHQHPEYRLPSIKMDSSLCDWRRSKNRGISSRTIFHLLWGGSWEKGESCILQLWKMCSTSVSMGRKSHSFRKCKAQLRHLPGMPFWHVAQLFI